MLQNWFWTNVTQSACGTTSWCITELNYNVMAHAQKTNFMYGMNRWVHILLQQVWGVDSSAHCWQLASALKWLVTGLLTTLSCSPSLSLHACSCHHTVIKLHHIYLIPSVSNTDMIAAGTFCLQQKNIQRQSCKSFKYFKILYKRKTTLKILYLYMKITA
jgi:hypothetical protein